MRRHVTVSVHPLPQRAAGRDMSPAVVLRTMAKAAGVPEIELLTSNSHGALKRRIGEQLWGLGFDYRAIGAAFGKRTDWAVRLLGEA